MHINKSQSVGILNQPSRLLSKFLKMPIVEFKVHLMMLIGFLITAVPLFSTKPNTNGQRTLVSMWLVLINTSRRYTWVKTSISIYQFKSCSSLLNDLADIFKVKPHFYKSCMLLGELSSYFLSLHEVSSIDNKHSHTFKTISRTLAKAAMDWAEDSCDSMKQVTFYRTSVLCLTHGVIDEEDVAIILPCIVKARNIFVQGGGSEETKLLKEFCEYKLSNCLDSYLRSLF